MDAKIANGRVHSSICSLIHDMGNARVRFSSLSKTNYYLNISQWHELYKFILSILYLSIPISLSGVD